MMNITVEKAKVGPLQERYVNGQFRSIKREKDGHKRYAVLGLDNSHSRDYKVAYASDPVLVVKSNDGEITHKEFRETLEEKGLWLDSFTAIDVPDGTTGWKVAFKSTPEQSHMFGHFKSRLEFLVDQESDLLEGENGATAYV